MSGWLLGFLFVPPSFLALKNGLTCAYIFGFEKSRWLQLEIISAERIWDALHLLSRNILPMYRNKGLIFY